jgi:hypothetical protein
MQTTQINTKSILDVVVLLSHRKCNDNNDFIQHVPIFLVVENIQ